MLAHLAELCSAAQALRRALTQCGCSWTSLEGVMLRGRAEGAAPHSQLLGRFSCRQGGAAELCRGGLPGVCSGAVGLSSKSPRCG